MDRFLELVLESGRTGRDDTADTNETTAPTSNDTGDVGAYSKDGVCEREGNGSGNDQQMDETLPSTSTGATSTVDDINTMEDIASLRGFI